MTDPTPHVCQVCHVPLREHGPACPVDDRTRRVQAALRSQIDRQTAQATAWESPQARARRLDAEADQASRRYREALQAADAAWRQIGGRP